MAEISRRAVIIAAGGASTALAAAVLLRNNLATGPAEGSDIPTSFGRVVLLGSTRLALAPAGEHGPAHGAAHTSTHGSNGVSGDPVASAVHGAWTEAVVVEVEVHNGSQSPVELSPGQFRVRVDGDGPTVSLYSADRDAGPVEPGSTTTMQIRYLAPSPDHPLSLEFEDTGAAAPVGLGRVGLPDAAGGRS